MEAVLSLTGGNFTQMCVSLCLWVRNHSLVWSKRLTNVSFQPPWPPQSLLCVLMALHKAVLKIVFCLFGVFVYSALTKWGKKQTDKKEKNAVSERSHTCVDNKPAPPSFFVLGLLEEIITTRPSAVGHGELELKRDLMAARGNNRWIIEEQSWPRTKKWASVCFVTLNVWKKRGRRRQKTRRKRGKGRKCKQ